MALSRAETAGDSSSSSNDDSHSSGEDPRKYRMWIRKCEAEMEAEETAVVPPKNDKKSDAAGDVANGAAAARSAPSSTGAAAMGSRAPVSSAPVHLRTRFQYYQSYEKV